MKSIQLHKNSSPAKQTASSLGQLCRLVRYPTKYQGSGPCHSMLCGVRDAFRSFIDRLTWKLYPAMTGTYAQYQYHGSSPVNETMLHSDCDLILKTHLQPNEQIDLFKLIQCDPTLYAYAPRQNNPVFASNVFTFTLQCVVGFPVIEIDITVLSNVTSEGKIQGVGLPWACKHFSEHSTEYMRSVYLRLYDTERWGLNLTSTVQLCRTVGFPHYPLVIFADHFSQSFQLEHKNPSYLNAIAAHFFAFMLNVVTKKYTRADFNASFPKMQEITETQWQSMKDQLFPDGVVNSLLYDFVQVNGMNEYEAITENRPDDMYNFIEMQKNCIAKLLCQYIYFGKGKLNHSRMVSFSTALKMGEVNSTNPTYCGPVFKRLHKLNMSKRENASTYAELVDLITKFQKWAGRRDI